MPVLLSYPTGKQKKDTYIDSVRNSCNQIELVSVLVVGYAFDVLKEGDIPLSLWKGDIFLPHDRTNSFDFDTLFDTAKFIQLSSGTTGHRKGIEFMLSNVVEHINDYDSIMNYQPDDVIVSWLPLYHDMGFIACFLASLIKKIDLVLIDPLEWVKVPSLLIDAISDNKGTMVYMPNFGFEIMSRLPGDYVLKSMRMWISCSEPT